MCAHLDASPTPFDAWKCLQLVPIAANVIACHVAQVANAKGCHGSEILIVARTFCRKLFFKLARYVFGILLKQLLSQDGEAL